MTTTQHTTTPEHPLPVDFPVLPGRTVDVVQFDIDANRHYLLRGIVVEANPANVTVQLAAGGFTIERAGDLVPVHPDLPMLSFDGFLAGAFGEQFAKRAGAEALAGFHRGHNDGRVAYTESARDMLREIDKRVAELRHRRCGYSYVENADGERQPRGAGGLGDRIVECLFFVDGHGANYCGVHRVDVAEGRLSDIYHAGLTEVERDQSRAAGTLVQRAPLPMPGGRAEPAEVELTEVEVKAIKIERIVDVVRDAIIADEEVNGGKRTEPGCPGRDLRELVERRSAELDEPLDLPLYWDALAYGVRRGLLVLHSGPRYSATPIYAGDAA